jgi:hypothetical protein
VDFKVLYKPSIDNQRNELEMQTQTQTPYPSVILPNASSNLHFSTLVFLNLIWTNYFLQMLSLVSANKLDAEVVRKKFSDVSFSLFYVFCYHTDQLSQIYVQQPKHLNVT